MIIKAKNFAVLDRESRNLLLSTMSDVNIKLLTSKESEFAQYDETFNPFDKPDYWIMVNRFALKKSKFNIRQKYELKLAYLRLTTLKEFKNFDLKKSYSDFVNLFLDWSGGRRHSLLGHLKLETFNEFIDRCESKFKNDFIYYITPRISRESNSIYQNDSSLKLVGDLVLELCSNIEKHSYTNYLIGPEITRLNDAISDLQDADHSNGYLDPYNLN